METELNQLLEIGRHPNIIDLIGYGFIDGKLLSKQFVIRSNTSYSFSKFYFPVSSCVRSLKSKPQPLTLYLLQLGVQCFSKVSGLGSKIKFNKLQLYS